MKECIWVCGATGFTGYYLGELFSQIGGPHNLVGLDRSELNNSFYRAYHQVDLNDSEALIALAGENSPTVVIHAAAATPPASDMEMWHANAGGTVNLLHALAKANCKPRFVSIGSAAEYMRSDTGFLKESDPTCGEMTYGKTKWAQSSLALALGEELDIPVMIARTFNLIGPNLPTKWVAASLCRQFKNKEPSEIKVGNTTSERDFLDIRDAVKAYWAIAQNGTPGQIYNVCSGIPTSIQQLIDYLNELTGNRHQIVINETLLRDIDLDRVYGDNTKLTTTIDWSPVYTVKQSLVDMLGE